MKQKTNITNFKTLPNNPSDNNLDISDFSKENIRKQYYNNQWHYSIIDIIEILEISQRPRKYWNELKNKLIENGFELSEKIGQFKLEAKDGKLRDSDCATRETIFRIIQSIPSKKVEIFKTWFAQLAEERISDIETYKLKGYDKSWINRRIFSKEKRDELTQEWKLRGINNNKEFAFLSHIIHKGTFDKSVQQHKQIKTISKKEELRDHMTDIELALISLSEATTTQITKKNNSKKYTQLSKDATKGAKIGKNARLEIEKELNESVISSENHLDKKINKNLTLEK